MKLSPIVLFVYNRPSHTQQTIEALQKNKLASESELFIYSDAPKFLQDQVKVQEVRDYIHSIGGFKKIIIIERKENWGLADSIIDGVTNIVSQYEKIIVLEDDLVTSPYFLVFMNKALDFYQNKNKVWHISGWNYQINSEGLNDVFLWRAMNCWGWATWADRWKYYEKNVDKLIAKFDKQMIRSFDLDNSGIFWSQVLNNKKLKINTWAIFWYATIFLKNGFCLNPTITYIHNIGLDGSGIHWHDIGVQKKPILNMNSCPNFPESTAESIIAVECIMSYFQSLKKPLYTRLINKISRMVLGTNIVK